MAKFNLKAILMFSHSKLLVLFGFIYFLNACISENNISKAVKDRELVDYVDPFIGTGGHGHTFPGPSMPFGMMQLGPDTRLEGWDGCSGYHYSDTVVYGFSHTHLSGTGVSDYGDILIMPSNFVEFNNGANGKKGYASSFSKRNEISEPGYYKTVLNNTNTQVELTCDVRSGVHRYIFQKNEPQVVIIDLTHRDKVLSSALDTANKRTVFGHRHSSAWAADQRLFFDLEFSRNYKKVTFLDNNKKGEVVKAAFEFDSDQATMLEIRIGISAVD